MERLTTEFFETWVNGGVSVTRFSVTETIETHFETSFSPSVLSKITDLKLRSDEDRLDRRRFSRMGTLNSKSDFDLRNLDGDAIGEITDDSGGGADGGDSDRLRLRDSRSGVRFIGFGVRVPSEVELSGDRFETV